MKKRLLNKVSVILFINIILILNIFFVINANAGGSDLTLWGSQASGIQANTGLGNDDPRLIAANLINIILGFLGILALALIIFAGFKWMTAAGNEDQVASAKKLLTAAVIGLIIILSSYSIASFVLDAVFRASTDGS